MIAVWCLPLQASPFIGEIIFEGNEVTEESILLREIYIQSGDTFDEKKLEQSRQAIMDLGLFKTVVLSVRSPAVKNLAVDDAVPDQTVDVVFTLEEKHYLLILPRLKANEDHVHVGMQVRWDNVWGLNHEMRLLLEDRGNTAGIDESRNSFEYYLPNFHGTPYNFDIELEKINEVDVTEGVIDRQDESYRIELSRWLNARGRNRGAFLGGSIKYQARFNEVVEGSDFSNEEEAVVVGLDFGYTNIREYDYNRGGRYYRYQLDFSDQRIGSDSEFTRHLLTYRSYYPVDANPLSNLNVQMLLGHSNHLILGKTAFSLGSGEDLRGYESGRFNGNTMFLTNVEYMFPQKNYPVVRYLYFIDIGNTYDAFKDIFHNPVHVGIGVGFRWKIRAFVKLDLRADLGYGISDEDYRFSFGTRHAF